ncbi:MAG: hypothetical protein OXU74_12625 [Gemmatimonadota bacterium]|nr:hypothetical protein [Gemmatimonadota bacterium]
MKAIDSIVAAPPSTLWLVLADTAPWSRAAAVPPAVRLIVPLFSSSAFAATVMPSVSKSAVCTV